MSGENCNRWFERRAKFLLMFAAAIVTVVVFAWRSQAEQNGRIRRNEKAVAVIDERLGWIVKKLDEIHELVKTDDERTEAPASGASWREGRGERRVTWEADRRLPSLQQSKGAGK